MNYERGSRKSLFSVLMEQGVDGETLTTTELTAILKEAPFRLVQMTNLCEDLAELDMEITDDLEITVDTELPADLPMDENLRGYLKEIEKLPPLTAEEITELSAKIAKSFSVDVVDDEIIFTQKEGDEEAKQRLIEAHLPMALTVAKEYLGHGYPMIDLVMEANLGLIKATENYRPEGGISFPTYAFWMVHHQLDELTKWNGAFVDFFTPAPQAELREEDDELKKIDEVWSYLTPKEREILYCRFGLGGERAHSRKEICERFGITQEEVKKLDKKAFRKPQNPRRPLKEFKD